MRAPTAARHAPRLHVHVVWAPDFDACRLPEMPGLGLRVPAMPWEARVVRMKMSTGEVGGCRWGLLHGGGVAYRCLRGQGDSLRRAGLCYGG